MHSTSIAQEVPVIIECRGERLIGIIHQAERSAKIGVLLVVGGPQYRVGSHRQFVLLARMLAASGIPVMRFDYRGMGDSEGEPRSFAAVDDDIAAAVTAFYQKVPELSGLVLWGLCDAASAALFYAYQDERVRGLVLLNPWVYTAQGAAKTYLKHYYFQRLLSHDFWRKIVGFKFNYLDSLASLAAIVATLTGKSGRASQSNAKTDAGYIGRVDANLSLPVRMRACLQRFEHPVLLILSGRDLTADEFRDAVAADNEWQALLTDERLSRHDFAESDHTFSSYVWREQVAEWTLHWLTELNHKLQSKQQAEFLIDG